MIHETVVQRLAVLGRMAIASLFVLGALNKLLRFDETALRMLEVGLSPTALLLPATIALEALAGLSIAFARPLWRVVAACVLALFTLATNWFFHDFWRVPEDLARVELSLFFKNIAIVGALIHVAAISIPARSAASNTRQTRRLE